MARIHNLGFPRMGRQRQLKFALENYWRGEQPEQALLDQAKSIRHDNWECQAACDLVPVGEFSLYDHVLDMSFLLGNVPERFKLADSELDQYFRAARGRSAGDEQQSGVAAGEMTKWFDTNYHYIVPELSLATTFELRPEGLITQIEEAKARGLKPKPVIIGPVSYLWLCKTKDYSSRLALLHNLLPVYRELFALLENHGVQWVQVDEPILVHDINEHWKSALEKSYHSLKTKSLQVLLTTYFGSLQDNLQLACRLPVAGLHLDAIRARDEVQKVIDWLPAHKFLSLGVIDGRNIWKNDLNATLDWLEPIAEQLGERIWLAPSCSLLHVPVDLETEQKLHPEIRNWLSFALQKLAELQILKTALNQGRDAVRAALEDNKAAMASRRSSSKVCNPLVQAAVAKISPLLGKRSSAYAHRAAKQKALLGLPDFPTTTIGSFPQTAEIRRLRRAFKNKELDKASYLQAMRAEISRSVEQQEALGIDVLVHGEPERNDMVEYFGEQLKGFAFSENGWVQSYGSRCVKPPIIYGDISRSEAMTVEWIRFAQGLTEKPMKGMLTGPVTILNWSFVRDDQPREKTCYQLALAVREEVQDLERAGVAIIQIDEAALREGLPLRKSQWQHYLKWAVESFRICANGVRDETQIHTHMCYSEFNDIIEAIARMDADVITIETSRSQMELLDVFEDYNYPNDIGPGVYDIHSPNIPTVEQMVSLMQQAAERIPRERLWVNPDCGLKTRRWEEVLPALKNMVAAAQQLRASVA